MTHGEKFQSYIDAGDELIRLHPDLAASPEDFYSTAAADQIASILHAVFDGEESYAQPEETPETLLDRALRCYQGDQEDRDR